MADPFAPTPIVVPRATGSLAPGDETNAKEQAKAAPSLMTIQQFATGIKKRQPELSIVPDDVLVRRMIEAHPELVHNIQTSQPRPKQTRDRTPTTEQRAQKFFENHPVIRESAMALAGGSAGIPESDSPVSDMFKGLWQTAKNPPQTADEKAVAPFITLPAYRIAKGIVQQGYGYGQEAFDAVDWQEVMKHPASFDVFKAAKEPAMMPDPTDPKKPPIPNPKAGQSIPGTGNEAQFAHGLVGLATTLYTVLKGGTKAKEGVKAAESAIETQKAKATAAKTETVQRMAGTGPILAEDVAEKAVSDTESRNTAAEEKHKTATERHADKVETIDERNATVERDFRTRIERINEDFGEKSAKVREQYAGDVKVRDQKISELRQQHIDAIKQARKEWVEKTHAAKTAEGTKESVENRKEVLQHTQRAYVDRIKENVAQTYNTVKGKLDARYENMRKRPAAIINEDTGETSEVAVKELPLDSTKLKEAVDKGRKTLQGAPADLKVFNDLVRQMEQGDGSMVDATDGAEPLLRPLTWDEGRTHFSALGDKLYSGELPGNVAKAIKEVRTTLDGELESAMVKGVTAKDGQGAGAAAKREYGQLKKDWSMFEDDWRDVGSEGKGASPLAKLRLAVDRGVIAANVLSKNFGDRLIETLAKYKDSGANPSLLDETRKYNREASSGSVNVSHFPGTTESVPSRFSVPKTPGKLELPDAPKEPPAVPSTDPKLAEIEADKTKKLERTTQDKPEPKPHPPAPAPLKLEPLPTVDKIVEELKAIKEKKARRFTEEQTKPTRHDVIMASVAATASVATGHLGYAVTYLGVRFGWGKFLNSEAGKAALTRITPRDIEVINKVLSKVPDEKPAATQAITAALVEKARKGEKIPPPSVFSKLLDKAQIGAILRVIAPPQPPPDQPQPVAQP